MLALLVMTVAVYAPLLGHEFVPLDDGMHITDNPHVRTGLDAANARWAFTNTELGYWVPLTWLSHQLDVSLFGLEPGPHHGVSLLLHLANTILLLLLLSALTGRVGPSAVVAGLFALHPLHVESVAWASERKDVLSTCFALLAMLAYVRYARRSGLWRYLLVLAFFVLGLMAKPMVVTLPLLLLLLDVWPLARFETASARRRALFEKVPMLLAAGAVAWITYRATLDVGAAAAMDPTAWTARAQSVLSAYLAYLGKTFWPSGLAVVYPYEDAAVSLPRLLVPAVLLLALTAILLRAARRRPYVATGWLWYLVALLPVVGLVRVGPAWIADRFTYLPLVGVFVLLVFGGADLARRSRWGPRIAAGVAWGVLLLCAWRSALQVAHWKDGESLFRHAVESTRDNFFMLTQYATLLHEQGDSPASLPYFEQALRLRPDLADIHVNHANALRAVGREEDALRHYEQAVGLEPNSAHAHYNLGVARGARGEFDAALRHYTAAVRLRPGFEWAYCNLGCTLLQLDRPAEAVAPLERAMDLAPDHTMAVRAYAHALASLDRVPEAVAAYERLLERRPEQVAVWVELGRLLHGLGERERAADCARRALALESQHPGAQALLRAASGERTGQ